MLASLDPCENNRQPCHPPLLPRAPLFLQYSAWECLLNPRSRYRHPCTMPHLHISISESLRYDVASLPPPPFRSSLFSLILSIRSWCLFSAICARDRPPVPPPPLPSVASSPSATAATAAEGACSDVARTLSPNHPLLPTPLAVCPTEARDEINLPVPAVPPTAPAAGEGGWVARLLAVVVTAPPPACPEMDERAARVLGESIERCLTLERDEPDTRDVLSEDELDEEE